MTLRVLTFSSPLFDSLLEALFVLTGDETINKRDLQIPLQIVHNSSQQLRRRRSLKIKTVYHIEGKVLLST